MFYFQPTKNSQKIFNTYFIKTQILSIINWCFIFSIKKVFDQVWYIKVIVS